MSLVQPSSRLVGATPDSFVPPQTKRKWPISYRSVGVFAFIFDILTVLLCGLIPGSIYHFEVLGTPVSVLHYFGAAAVVAAFFASVMKARNLYSPAELLDVRMQIGTVATTWIGVFLFLAGAVFALKIGDQFSRVAVFSFAATGLGCLVIERILYRALLKRGLAEQKFSGRNAILITDQGPAAARGLASDLLKYGFRLNRQLALPDLGQNAKQLESFVPGLVQQLRGSDIDEIVIGIDVARWEQLSQLLPGLRKLPLPVMLVPVGAASDILSRPSHALGETLCIELQREPLDAFERAAKRTMDVIISFTGLVLLLPLLTITAILIKLDSPGPILFRQKRCGFNGRPFNIFKFRTMSVLEDGASITQAMPADTRVTRVGAWLRRSSIDELPQLLNVLSGSMSLVGPRPHALIHDSQFDKAVSRYAFRHHVKPGLTGWAQVNGQRGPTPTVDDISRRVDFDLWYIDNWSLRLDIVIIIRTIFEVLRGRNAF